MLWAQTLHRFLPGLLWTIARGGLWNKPWRVCLLSLRCWQIKLCSRWVLYLFLSFFFSSFAKWRMCIAAWSFILNHELCGRCHLRSEERGHCPNSHPQQQPACSSLNGKPGLCLNGKKYNGQGKGGKSLLSFFISDGYWTSCAAIVSCPKVLHSVLIICYRQCRIIYSWIKFWHSCT